jgi:hypothetical protein
LFTDSDAEERYDSDPDSFPPPRNVRKSSPTKEYKDSESIDSSPPPTIGKLNSPIKTSSTAKTKTSTPSRRVDLGAAANYGKTQVGVNSSMCSSFKLFKSQFT